jgi:hypothetical protein
MARELKYTRNIELLLTLMLVKQQQQSVYYSILENHIKLVKYTMVLQQWNGLDGTREEEVLQLLLLLQLVNGIFQLQGKVLPEIALPL